MGVPQNGWFIMEVLMKNDVNWMVWGYPSSRKLPYHRGLERIEVFPRCRERFGSSSALSQLKTF